MSESTPNPSTSDPSAKAPAEADTVVNPAADTTAAEASGAQASAPTGKRKRKRKRKRKPSALSATENGETLVAAGEASAQSANTDAQNAPKQNVNRPSLSPKQGAFGGGARSVRHEGKGGAQAHGKKKPPFEARRHTLRDSLERSSGRHEFLAAWRWQPNATFLALLTPVTSNPDATAEDAALEADHAVDTASTDGAAATQEPASEIPSTETDDADVPEVSQASASPSVESEQPSMDEATAPSTDTPSADVRSPAKAAARPAAAKKSGLVVPTGQDFAPWLTRALEQCDAALRPSLLVSLCSHRSFRQQCANSDAESRAIVDRAAAVYDALFLDSPPTVAPSGAQSEPHHDGRDTLREGLEAVSSGAMELVRVWPQAARERLFELASDFELHTSLYSSAQQLFHDSPKQLGRVNLARICDALASGDDNAAKAQIAELKTKAAAPGLLPLLSEALDGQRFGNLVILSYGGSSSRGADPRAPKRHSGFCLESQRDVWIRAGETHESQAFEHYSQLHRRALIPSVVGLYTFGVTRSRKPYLSVLRKGISLQRRIEHGWGLSREWAVRFATDLTLLASSLCRAGIRLPDLDPRRFEVDDVQRLWLSDLWGGELIEPKAQDPEAVSICRDAVVGLLSSQPGFVLPNDWREVLAHSADFETLVATLRTLEKSRHWSAS